MSSIQKDGARRKDGPRANRARHAHAKVKNETILAHIRPQTGDITCGHGFDRSDVVLFGSGSDQLKSCSRHAAPARFGGRRDFAEEHRREALGRRQGVAAFNGV